MLSCKRDAVALVQAVVDGLQGEFLLAEFVVLGAEVLGAGVQPVNLSVGGVRDQRDVLDPVLLGEGVPVLHGGLACLVAGVLEVQLSLLVVVGDCAGGFAGPQRLPRLLLLGVMGAVDVVEFGGGGVLGDAVEHAAGADRGELLTVTYRDQLRAGALHEVGERVEAFVVCHPSLVENDGRVGSDVNASGVGAGEEGVERHRLPM